MERKTLLGIFAFTIVALLGVSSFVAAHGFIFVNSLTDGGRAEMQAKHQAIQEAISNGNFSTWKSLQEERIAKMQAQLTEENFNKIVERQNQMKELREAIQKARETGDFSKVEKLKEQYGIEGSLGRDHFGMKGFMGLHKPIKN